jgi:hypothetical protein
MATMSEGGSPGQRPGGGQPAGQGPVQPTQGTGGQQAPQQQEIRVHLDERALRTTYANAFLTHATPNELLIDFALNLGARPAQQQGNPAEMVWQVGERIIINYFTAKQLAINLGQLVRQYEEQFGVLELDPAKRRK